MLAATAPHPMFGEDFPSLFVRHCLSFDAWPTVVDNGQPGVAGRSSLSRSGRPLMGQYPAS